MANKSVVACPEKVHMAASLPNISYVNTTLPDLHSKRRTLFTRTEPPTQSQTHELSIRTHQSDMNGKSSKRQQEPSVGQLLAKIRQFKLDYPDLSPSGFRSLSVNQRLDIFTRLTDLGFYAVRIDSHKLLPTESQDIEDLLRTFSVVTGMPTDRSGTSRRATRGRVA